MYYIYIYDFLIKDRKWNQVKCLIKTKAEKKRDEDKNWNTNMGNT